ncbi:beta-glucosidase family protein [Hyphomonas sp.]|uniref:beta-glucosidase family protein n=1 Tax=Hyphomonas sp. TaxID=87 RepID=UPI0039E4708E
MTDFSPQKGLTPEDIRQLVDSVIVEATLEEKVAMMSGRGFFALHKASGVWGSDPYRAGGGVERLGIPPFYFTDGPRGVARGRSTAFPCTMARGASFDTDLERRVGEVMGIEIRAQGCNLSGAVCVNLLRHPAWGRAQETYGEDSYHLGEMGAALSEGIQVHNVAATVKHFAVNSIENCRFKVDVRVEERALREVYLPHFKRILEAGCATVMSAYNKLNGEYCGENQRLLTDILRHEWGFDGFVHSDWIMGVRSPWGAVAGLDIENPEPVHYAARLIGAVENGQIAKLVVDTACRRILNTYYRFACAQDPLEDYPLELVAAPQHRALALEVAEKSAVLLRNEDLLPLDLATVGCVAVFGNLADLPNTGDNGSSRVRAPYTITPLGGLQEYAGESKVILGGNESDVDVAAQAASAADVAVVIVGYTADEEGEYIPGDLNLGQDVLPADIAEALEGANAGNNNGPRGGDRDSLALPESQVALIEAVSAANPRTIVVVLAGSAVLFGPWVSKVGAVLQTFYSGMEGGRALARLVFGEVSPSGKLPFTVASDPAHYPHFDKNADAIDYGYWHGYALLDRDGIAPAFCFGYGLTYGDFSYRALSARCAPSGDIIAQVSVRNDGAHAATEVAQLYLAPPGIAAERPKKILRGFQRVELAPGETKTVRFRVPADGLDWYDPETATWKTESGAHGILVGGSSLMAERLQVSVKL